MSDEKPPTIFQLSAGGVPQPVYWFCHVCATVEKLPQGTPHICKSGAPRFGPSDAAG